MIGFGRTPKANTENSAEQDSFVPVEQQTDQNIGSSFDTIAANFYSKFADVIVAWGGEKVKQKNILNSFAANTVSAEGYYRANQLGLSDTEKRAIAPFPAVQSLNLQVPQKQGFWGSVKDKAIPFAATALLGGLGGVGVLSLFDRYSNKPEEQKVESTVDSTDDSLGKAGISIE